MNGHQEAVYRYGEPMELEAQHYAPLFREPDAQGPDPALHELYGGVRLFLPPGLHRLVHNAGADAVVRAEMLLNHIGYGNLPHSSAWSSTESEAFEDLAHEALFDAAEQRPATHVTFRILPLTDGELPVCDVRASWARFVNSPGIDVQVAGMSWRSPGRPWVTHSAGFDPPLDAAIAPEYQRDASAAYRARYSELGDLLPGQKAHRGPAPSPFVGRGAEITAMANRLLEGIAQRAMARPAAAPSQASSAEQQQAHRHGGSQQAPRIR